MEGGKGIDCTKTYTYDKVGRLVTSNVVNKAEGTAENKNAEYTYDKVGNRKTEKDGDETTTYAYNGLNQLTEAETMKAGETAAASKKAYTYDRNGSQISQSDSVTGESAALTYDAAGRLSKYEAKKDNAVVVTQENRYNGNGQRIQKKETQGSQAKTRNYYYQSGTVLYTSDEGGKLTSLNLMGSEGNVIATQRKGEGSPAWYLYNKDIRESTSSMINSSGELAAAYEYDEFGNTTVRAGENFDNEICYTGQVYDQSTGLYYYNARFYDPEDGRFLTQDTYRGEEMEPGTWNLYTYCANDPVNYVDPSGHAKKRRSAIPNKKYTTKKSKVFKPFLWVKPVIKVTQIVKWEVKNKEIKERKVGHSYKYYRRRNHSWRFRSSKVIKNEVTYNGQRANIKMKVTIENKKNGSLSSVMFGVWIYNDGGRDWD